MSEQTSEYVKKLTMKGIVPDLSEQEIKKPTPLAHIFGVARKFKNDRTTYGDFIRFYGSFEAVNVQDGTVQKSGSMILPPIAENLLAGGLAQEGTEAVEFAFEIGVKPSKSPVGYDYTVKPLVENRDTDPLAALREASQQAQKALPAPEKKVASGGSK